MSASPITAMPVPNVPMRISYQFGRTDEEFFTEFFRDLPPPPKREDVPAEAATKDSRWEPHQSSATGYSTSSTARCAHLEEIGEALLLLFKSARELVFEDGVETFLSQEFVLFIQRYGTLGVSLFGEISVSESVGEEAISEALRWLGRITDVRTDWARLQLLGHLLRSPSSKVRDGAALGLASMGKADAIPFLRKAIREEIIEDLRKDMELVLRHIERAR